MNRMHDYRNYRYYQTIVILPTMKATAGYNDGMNNSNYFHFLKIAAAVVLLALTLLPACTTHKVAPGQEVWAEVDDQPIYREQVERLYRGRTAQGTDAATLEEAASFKLNVLNELINNQILVTHASHSRITASEAEVDAKVGELKSPYSPEEFEKKLQEQGLDSEALRKQIRENLILTKLINKDIISHINVTDAEIASYYEKNKANFNVTETTYHIAQIQVTPRPDAEVRNLKNDDAKTPAAAEHKIQALYQSLEHGEDFATVAQEYSEDPSTAAGGGDMGFIPASGLNAALKQVVNSLKVGQVSPIIRSNIGFHIFKLLGVEEAGQHTLTDLRVQSAIRQTLRNEKEQLLKAAYIEMLRNRSKVVNHFAEEVVKANGLPPSAG
ncbi:MAG TPA: peptidylprolyl isomerase [Terriglobia bacterium]|nr:peptidylprolyl isomerase [Terriglobia bacterium]